ncbi:MAG: alpha/beta family hydrolase, partial [Gaiellales bacterium]
FNFVYTEKGRRSPDRPPVLVATWRAAAAWLAARPEAKGRPLVLGGKSMGGRIASMAAAEGMPAAGLVFLGYPLHPPGKPDRLRDDHLDSVPAPMLFLQGTRDPFATPELLGRVAARLGPRAELRWVDGGDHSFRVPGPRIDAASIGAGLASPAAEFARRHATIGLD